LTADSSSAGGSPVESTGSLPDPLGAFRLDDQVAIVTGASSGRGVRFAEVLHAAGATVVVAARRLDRLEALVERLPGSVAVECDVSIDADLEALVATTIERFGRIDVLVNNAGIGTVVPAEDEPIAEFRRVIEVNLNALFLLSQLVGRQMLAQGSGSIINVSSILGLVASAPIKQASYTASKGAVVNLTREMAVEWARKGVRVNAIAPGWFPSEMTSEMFEDDSSLAYMKRNAPMGRGGEPHELDGALLYLAGDASGYVTGQVLTVDGGWVAR
jgi:NAD(P)-dependent dehydrogenase (short-subunit alcohol dehydrogenase family)